jgi:hypothetical protein
MKIEAAHGAEGEKMVIPLLGRGRGDGDFLWTRPPRGNQRARPSQRFEGLVPRARARFGMNFRIFRWGFHDRNAERGSTVPSVRSVQWSSEYVNNQRV